MDFLRRAALLVTLLLAGRASAEWVVTPFGAAALDSGDFSVAEMSGITHAGGSRFYVVQDSGAQVVSVDVAFDANGVSQAGVAAVYPLSNSLDYEGIASGFDESTWFVAEEGSPGVREVHRDSGALVRALSIPGVFANRRGNRGFESLVRNDSLLWTANEEALTVDGPSASVAGGTTVRLLKIDAATGDPLQQHAYQVEPIHATGLASQSGLADLLVAPDGRLIALERSFAGLANPSYLTRIYEIDLAGATDVSQPPFANGLEGQSFTAVGKRLLWSGSIGTLGQNLEGLALGPQQADGSWALVGVVDNGGGDDPFSGNTVVGFTLSPAAPQTAGDYTGDGLVDQSDYAAWRRAYGLNYTAGLGADGSGDGVVNAADYVVWRDALAGNSPVASQPSAPTPEPGAGWLGVAALVLSILRRRASPLSRARPASA